MNKLIEYLPQKVYEDNIEIKHLTNAELPEVESLWTAINEVKDNQFITTSNSTRIRLWERLLKIRPDFITQDLDYRKEVVLLRIALTPPFTYRWLESILRDRVGEGNYTIDLNHNKYEVDIRITHDDVNMINEFRIFFRDLLPANLAISISRVVNQEVEPVRVTPVIIKRTQNTHLHMAVERSDNKEEEEDQH